MIDYKTAGIGIVSGFAFAAFGWFFAAFAIGNQYGALTAAGVVALLYLVSATVRMLVIEKATVAAGLIAIDIALFALSFASNFSGWLFVACAIAWLWLFKAWQNGKKAVGNMVKIHMQELGRSFVRTSLHAMLFLTIAVYLSLLDPAKLAVSRAFIESSVSSTMKNGGAEFLKRIADAPLSERETASVTDKVVSGIYKAANDAITTIPAEARTGILIGLGLVAFLLLNSVTGLAIPLITGFVWVSVRLLLRLKFITIVTEKIDKETITA